MEVSDDRIERLLALLLVQSMKTAGLKEKISQLNIAGFTNIEIAEFLQTSPASVATFIYQAKKKTKTKKPKK